MCPNNIVDVKYLFTFALKETKENSLAGEKRFKEKKFNQLWFCVT